MGRLRWNADKQYRWRFGTGRWWILFAGGVAVVALVKGVALTHIFPHQEERGLPFHIVVQDEQEQQQKQQQLPQIRKDQSDKNVSTGDKLSSYDRLRVQVYLATDKRMEKLPIELYVRGVLAAEMPIEFELEALKAQAIAARTYIYRRLYAGENDGLPSNATNADVTDSVKHQVYLSLNELFSRWKGEQKKVNLNKLNQAVEETKGQIITYENKPIQAAFFSTSNGYTENAEDYWAMDLPYLRSVASPWDKDLSPRYKEITKFKLSDAAERLGVKANEIRSMRVIETTKGKRVKEVAIGKKRFSGREVREKLGLASSQFNWTIEQEFISITTYGFGHGVGMSQWGANGMAKEGSTAEQIISHYYTGTQVEQASKLPIPGSS